MRRDDYFPTLVYSTKLQDTDAMNRDILAAIQDERDRDNQGIERSNFRSLGGWHSHNNLHKDPKFQRLTRRAEQMCAGISSDLGYDRNRFLEVTTMWSIANPPGSSNRAHIHPGALWSGVFYVQAPEGAGQIEFIDPRTVHLMNSATFIPKQRRKMECWTKVKPVAGKMLFFPSWLYHSVEPNLPPGTGNVVPVRASRAIIRYSKSACVASCPGPKIRTGPRRGR
ncbi:TIGR02466 family protein [Chachezhania sediminis]|uniref:TIGR02466 family protein n=1 Tax=Chachezhania sediminis TaxID=2599291 RepID=UPI00131C4B49|nr:TIGR02466 family protein [Chachezhania sediminis]